MSVWGSAGRVLTRYMHNLNLPLAKGLVRAGWSSGGALGAATGLGRWAMGHDVSQRMARMGTVAAAGYLMSNRRARHTAIAGGLGYAAYRNRGYLMGLAGKATGSFRKAFHMGGMPEGAL